MTGFVKAANTGHFCTNWSWFLYVFKGSFPDGCVK